MVRAVSPVISGHSAETGSGPWHGLCHYGIGALERATLDDESITQACVAQLVRLFGPEAGSPVATILKDWAADPLTATAADATSSGHPRPGTWVDGPWGGRLHLAGSEVSPTEAGYLAGAVDASRIAVDEALAALD